MAYAYANLMNPVNTGSGVAEYLLLAPVTAFTDDGIKCPEAPFTNPGDEVTVREAHEFLQNEGFIKVQLAPEKNQLNAATIGDRGFSKLDMTLDVFIPGSYAAAHEAVKNWLNKPLIALIKDAECKAEMYYQLGCDCASAWLSVDFSTGTTKEGVKGYAGKLTYQNGYIQVYMGPAPKLKGSTPTAGLPVFTTQPTNQTVNVGGAFSFTAAASGTGVTLKWQKNDADIPSGTGGTYGKANAAIGDAGTYKCVATNSAGSVSSNPVTLTVNQVTAFDTVMDFTNSGLVADQVTGVEGNIGVPSATVKMKYNKVTPVTGFPARMDLSLNGTPVGAWTTQDCYVGKPWAYVDANGVEHPLTFAAGTVNI